MWQYCLPNLGWNFRRVRGLVRGHTQGQEEWGEKGGGGNSSACPPACEGRTGRPHPSPLTRVEGRVGASYPPGLPAQLGSGQGSARPTPHPPPARRGGRCAEGCTLRAAGGGGRKSRATPKHPPDWHQGRELGRSSDKGGEPGGWGRPEWGQAGRWVRCCVRAHPVHPPHRPSWSPCMPDRSGQASGGTGSPHCCMGPDYPMRPRPPMQGGGLH